MVKWRIDRNNKVPLYLQLKDLIKYYISTGTIKDHHQLPGVNTLGKELNINFETVRKAYKELEREGLISMERGKGTYVTLHGATIPKSSPVYDPESQPVEAVKSVIKRLYQTGLESHSIKKIVKQAMDEMEKESTVESVIFTECNTYQINETSKLLEEQLNLNVIPVLLKDLRKEVERIQEEEGKILAIITTGFHINEIRTALGDLPINIHVLITNMSPETRRFLDSLDASAKIGFICRDHESIPLYKDLLRAEVGNNINLSLCTMSDESMDDIVKNSDVLLVTPPALETIKKIAPKRIPVYDVFERVDPMSLMLIKDRIMRSM